MMFDIKYQTTDLSSRLCSYTTFDYYFNDIYSKLLCTQLNSKENLENKEFTDEQNFHDLNTKKLKEMFYESKNKFAKSIDVEFIIVDEFVKRLQISIKINPTSLITFEHSIFSFRLTECERNRNLLYLLLGFYLAYYGYEKIHEIARGQFLNSQKLLFDILDLINFYLAIMSIFYAYNFYNSNSKELDSILKYKNFNSQINAKELLKNFVNDYRLYFEYFSMFYIVSFSRFFKYSIIYRPFDIIVKSIKTIFSNIFQFSFFFLVIYFGFALFGLSVFGSEMQEFSSLKRACLTLTGIVFGELKFKNYYEYHHFIGTAYFCLYVITIVIILFNILSVVITESYRSIKTFMKSESQKLNIVPDCYFLKRNFNYLVNFKSKYYEERMREMLEGRIVS